MLGADTAGGLGEALGRAREGTGTGTGTGTGAGTELLAWLKRLRFAKVKSPCRIEWDLDGARE